MDLVVTSMAASFLVVLYVVLGLRVIHFRRTGVGQSVGMGGDERFVRAVRAHGNLGEYAPLFLILLGLYELQDGNCFLAFGLATIFCIGRIMHAIGFGYLGTGPWRTLGMVATNCVLLLLACVLVYQIITI